MSDSACSDDGVDASRMRSITYRIATGAQAGRKVAPARPAASRCTLAWPPKYMKARSS